MSNAKMSTLRNSKVRNSYKSLKITGKHFGAETDSIDGSNYSKKINYREELVRYFCDQMLPYIVAFWEVLEVDDSKPETSSEISYDLKEKALSIISNRRKSTIYSNTVTRYESMRNSFSFNSIEGSAIVEAKNISKYVALPSELICNASMFDWFVPPIEEYVHIVFKNGNEYVGPATNKIMHGKGLFVWDDGAYYDGEFKIGKMTGVGIIKYAECSYYKGQFCNGMLHGMGAFYPLTTSMVYNGGWRYGKKHGKGWMLYVTGDYYDGEWVNDCKEGYGYRQYLNGAVYSGHWKNNLPDGHGMMHYYNNDFYKGEWSKGYPHGYGEYTWKAGMVPGLTFTIENRYQGYWVKGKRDGHGTLFFGMEGSKLTSKFKANMKHGPGTIVCGDGSIFQKNQLFYNDKVSHKNSIPKTQSKFSLPSQAQSVKSFQSLKSKHESYMSMKKSISGSKFRLSLKCSPVTIPIHGTAANIKLSGHISKLMEAFSNCVSEQVISTRGIVISDETHLNIEVVTPFGVNYDFEEKKLRDAILFNYQILENLYKTYASLTYASKTIKPVLTRLFLWQMYRDLDLQKIGMSLVQLDDLLTKFPNSAIESKHSPFEMIYFWQFLHLILLICWEYYCSIDYIETYKESGIYAQMLKDFIKDFIYPNFGTFKGESLFKYKDLLPIQAVYSLYKSIGEPHTARTFMRRCCVRKWEEPRCYLSSGFKAEPVKIFSGTNSVCTGTNIVYMPEEPPDIGQKSASKCECPFDRDQFYRDLKIFRSLGPKVVLSCLCQISPLIKRDNLISYINYELTFLEFYEVLLLLSLELIAQIKKEEGKLLTADHEESSLQVANLKMDSVPTSSKKKGNKVKK